MWSSPRRPPLPPTPDDGPLLAALGTIRERGPIGERSLRASIENAERFVRLIPETARRLADLGSGGGLPGLVVAVRRPELVVTLVERRRSRADLLRRAVGALDLGGRVRVIDTDVALLAAVEAGSFDVITARSFGPPATTARWAGRLLVVGGRALVSEPPAASPGRWPVAVLAPAGLRDSGVTDGIRCLTRDVPRGTMEH